MFIASFGAVTFGRGTEKERPIMRGLVESVEVKEEAETFFEV